MFRTEMALRAILMHNIRQARTHHKYTESGRRTPVHVDAVGCVIGRGLEINETVRTCPRRGHTIASLVGAEGLGEDDICEPGCIGDFAWAEDEITD